MRLRISQKRSASSLSEFPDRTTRDLRSVTREPPRSAMSSGLKVPVLPLRTMLRVGQLLAERLRFQRLLLVR